MPIPPSSHILYIPALLILGIVLGFIMGARAARDQARMTAVKDIERRAAREARAVRRAAKSAGSEGEESEAEEG